MNITLDKLIVILLRFCTLELLSKNISLVNYNGKLRFSENCMSGSGLDKKYRKSKFPNIR